MHRVKPDGFNETPFFDRCLDDSFPLISLCKRSYEEKKAAGQFDEEELKKLDQILQLVSDEEIKWIKDNIPEGENVLSHNDFLNGNILKLPENKLVLIDFEYSSYNLRTFDIANFITESLFDYEAEEAPYFKYYPEKRDSKEVMRDVIKFYLLFSSQQTDLPVDEALPLCEDEAKANEMLVSLLGSQEEVDSQIEAMMKQLDICYLLSHFLWIIWSVVVCKNPNIKFGYIDFGYQRLLDYLQIKKTAFGC
jgi:choline/ethanolamine kinase